MKSGVAPCHLLCLQLIGDELAKITKKIFVPDIAGLGSLAAS
jgi:hypothetical protein